MYDFAYRLGRINDGTYVLRNDRHEINVKEV
jgi:hypothetical protein